MTSYRTYLVEPRSLDGDVDVAMVDVPGVREAAVVWVAGVLVGFKHAGRMTCRTGRARVVGGRWQQGTLLKSTCDACGHRNGGWGWKAGRREGGKASEFGSTFLVDC